METFLSNFSKKYSDKEVHIVSNFENNIIPTFLENLRKKYNFRIHTNPDPDHDLWLLLNSDILVLSKSTFSLIAGYYHQGTVVHYPIWGTFVSTGLNTKFDRSNWIPYV